MLTSIYHNIQSVLSKKHALCESPQVLSSIFFLERERESQISKIRKLCCSNFWQVVKRCQLTKTIMSKTSRLHEQNLENTSTGIKISAGPEVKGVTPKLVGIEGKLVLHVLSIL